MHRIGLVVDGGRPICHSANATPTHVAILWMYNVYPWVMLPKSLIFDIFPLSDFPVMYIPGIIFDVMTQKYLQEYFII
jgi:hypothetical protein